MNTRKLLPFVLLLVAFSVTAFAQQNIRWRGSDGWGASGRYEQMFSINSPHFIEGTIARIDTVTPMNDMSYGIMIAVNDGMEEHVVHLGPAWYMLFQDLNLSVNERVEVRGARASFGGNVFIMAIEVRRDNRILHLRDEDGVPNWIAWRRR